MAKSKVNARCGKKKRINKTQDITDMNKVMFVDNSDLFW